MEKQSAIVIGTGIAGCVTAIKLAEKLDNVLLITKETNEHLSNSYYAQGGIIYRGETDAWDILKQDIMFAGAGECKQDAVGVLCDYGASDVKNFLIKKIGVPFERDKEGKLDLTSEGAHSINRIIHCSDNTGKEIILHLHEYIKKKTNITVLSGYTVLDLITTENTKETSKKYDENTCYGIYVLDNAGEKILKCKSDYVILAAGGCGSVYKISTNPSCTTGDGYAIAHRANAGLINLEYTQFHPTSLYHGSGDRFLISESVRGEGGILKTPDGKAFMKRFHKMKDLAPRDVVTRSILNVMIENDLPCVFLDCSGIGEKKLKTRFPNIYKTCLDKYHFDITKSWIPVSPAFHFMCGGVKTDIYGRTGINRLYAVGEAACTGLHGANRLASTSLLEGLVFGIRTAEDIVNRIKKLDYIDIEATDYKYDYSNTEKLDPVIIYQISQTLKNLMWNFVGPIRTYQRMKLAVKSLVELEETVNELFMEHKITKELVELRNSVTTGLLIAKAARNNKISKGCHFVTTKKKS